MGSAKAVVYKWDSTPDEIKTALLGEYIPYNPNYAVAGKDWETVNLVSVAIVDVLSEGDDWYWASRTNLDGMYIRVIGRRVTTKDNPRTIFGKIYGE